MTPTSFITHAAAWLAAALLALAPPAALARQDATEKAFRAFLESDIWPAAKARGVSRAVFDEALAGVRANLTLPDIVRPGDSGKVAERNDQAEFRSPAAYFGEKELRRLAARGRSLLAENKALLRRVEARTGVPGPIVVAIWGRETGFGAAKLPYDAFEVLATKAYLSRRKALFRDELLAALDILAAGDMTRAEMRSSSAGALGQPQFMPSKFREVAVDFDGDGRRDIARSVPDTLASIGAYLQAAGWARGRDWGFEAKFPDAVSCAEEGPDKGRPIKDFVAAGVSRVSGAAFPKGERSAVGNLLMPAGRLGPAFVATPNFYVLKSYNNSDLYALFIGHVADRIAGGGAPFAGGWGETDGLTRGDVARLQEALAAKGYDVGTIDGLAGFKTRRSIGAVEAGLGLTPTCWPSKALAARLAR